MGIKRFYASFLRRVEREFPIFSGPSGPNSTFAYDANALLHTVAQRVYGYGKTAPDRLNDLKERLKVAIGATYEERMDALQKELLEEYIEEVKKEINDTLSHYRPQDYFIFCIDGVPPEAKVWQQRQRQAKSDEEKEFFDSSMIKPGTEWMFAVCNELAAFIESLPRTRNIFASFHLSPGEGEHKIFEQLRNSESAIRDRGNIIVAGNDADLNVISLLSGFRNIYILREENDRVSYINIDQLRAYLLKYGTFKDKPQDEETVISDFALISCMIGNDFLPHLSSFTEVADVLTIVFGNFYRNLQLRLTTRGISLQINFANLSKFLNYVADQEGMFLLPILDKAMKKGRSGYLNGYPMIEQSIVGEEFDRDVFRGLWYDRILRPRTEMGREIWAHLDLPVNVQEDEIEDLAHHYLRGLQWVLNYYTNPTKYLQSYVFDELFAPLLEDLAKYSEGFSINVSEVMQPAASLTAGMAPERVTTRLDDDESDESFVERRRLAEEERNNFWQSFKSGNSDNRSRNAPLNPLQQMLAITPYLKLKFVPDGVRGLLKPGEEYSYLAPESFEEDTQGIYAKWEAQPFVPPVDFEEIRYAFRRPDKRYLAKKDIFISRSASAIMGPSRGRGRGRGATKSREAPSREGTQEATKSRGAPSREAPRVSFNEGGSRDTFAGSRGASRGAPSRGVPRGASSRGTSSRGASSRGVPRGTSRGPSRGASRGST
jgi:hypothetical protein